MQDGDQSVGERGDPAQARLPQRPAELLFAGAQVDGHRFPAGPPVQPVRVPPAAPVAHREEASAGGPLDLRDGLLGSAEHGTGLREPAVRSDLGEPELGAVPRHPGVVPHQPGRLPPVRGEPGPGAEPVSVVGQLPHQGPVFRGRPVQRYGGRHAAHIGRPGSGELLHHAPDFAVPQHRVGPAQPAADRRDGRQGPRRGAAGSVGLVRVQPLVGEVDEDHQRSALGSFGARPGLPAVLGDPAAHVPRRGQRAHRGAAVRGPADQGAATALGRPGHRPPHLGADRADVLRPPVEGGGQRGADGRGPTAVGGGAVAARGFHSARRARSRTRTPKCRASTGTRSSTPWKRDQ